ncbi:MAG: tRNA-dihydrouridine synthase [Myxococcota bacterium]
MHAETTIGPLGLPVAYKVRDIHIAPGVVLAPMEGVTNLTFRRLIRDLGSELQGELYCGPGLTYTEFIPSKGLKNGATGKLAEMIRFDPDELPIAIQIYGREPHIMAEAARIVEDLGASICDINMGCPSKRVCNHSGGSALMREPELAVAIVRAVRAAISIPLTVKMRSGFDAHQRNAPALAYACQEEGAEAITIHWRTREDRYGGQRAVDKIAQTVDRVSVPVIGNGDIVDPDSAVRMLEETGCDGVMIGRGSMRNPWCLLQIAQHLRGHPVTAVTAAERKRALLAFLERFYEDFRKERAALGRFKQIAKHFTRDLPDGPTFQKQLLRSQSIEAVREHTDAYFAAHDDDAILSLTPMAAK